MEGEVSGVGGRVSWAFLFEDWQRGGRGLMTLGWVWGRYERLKVRVGEMIPGFNLGIGIGNVDWMQSKNVGPSTLNPIAGCWALPPMLDNRGGNSSSTLKIPTAVNGSANIKDREGIWDNGGRPGVYQDHNAKDFAQQQKSQNHDPPVPADSRLPTAVSSGSGTDTRYATEPPMRRGLDRTGMNKDNSPRDTGTHPSATSTQHLPVKSPSNPLKTTPAQISRTPSQQAARSSPNQTGDGSPHGLDYWMQKNSRTIYADLTTTTIPHIDMAPSPSPSTIHNLLNPSDSSPTIRYTEMARHLEAASRAQNHTLNIAPLVTPRSAIRALPVDVGEEDGPARNLRQRQPRLPNEHPVTQNQLSRPLVDLVFGMEVDSDEDDGDFMPESEAEEGDPEETPLNTSPIEIPTGEMIITETEDMDIDADQAAGEGDDWLNAINWDDPELQGLFQPIEDVAVPTADWIQSVWEQQRLQDLIRGVETPVTDVNNDARDDQGKGGPQGMADGGRSSGGEGLEMRNDQSPYSQQEIAAELRATLYKQRQ